MRALPLALLFALTLGVAGIAAAQSIGDEQKALVEAKRQAALAGARAARFEEQAAEAVKAADKARASESAVASRVKAAEADIAAAQARVAIIERLRAEQRVRLARRQLPIVRLAGALQVMARRPPALALVQPGSLADLIHVRALLASSLPLVRARTADLRTEIARGDQLRASTALAVATLRAGEAKLQAERRELVRLELVNRWQSQRFSDSALVEQDRAMALGEQARDIADLMEEMDVQANVRDRLLRLPSPLVRPALPFLPAAGRERAEAPASGYRLPVRGRLVTGLGEVSEAGVRARGLTIATDAGARVIAPAAGRVLFAAPFRGYGMIVILDHGDGWTSLVTGLSALAVGVGHQVEAGRPLGRTGDAARVTVELRRRGQPVDITALVAAG